MTDSTIEATQSIMIYNELAVLYDKKDGDWVNPKPLSQDDLKELIIQPSVPYPLPPNMIWYEEYKMMIWHSKPCKRKIKIRQKDYPTGFVTKYYCHPGILFKVQRGNNRDYLSLAVVAPDFDPSNCHDQPTYEYPYSNHDTRGDSGNMGACKVTCPNAEFAYDLEGSQWRIWEDSFYESGFNKQPTKRNLLKPRNITVIDWMQHEYNKNH